MQNAPDQADAQPPAQNASPEPAADAAGPARRKGPPAWAVVLFLLLLAGMAFVNYRAAEGGAPVAWIENDVDRALQLAGERHQRVFLYLYEPNDPQHRRNDREVFAKAWARDKLKFAVCCRVAVEPGTPLADKYEFHRKPLFMLLDATGRPLREMRREGAPDETEFFTFIGKPAKDYAERQAEKRDAPK
jgi:hypothetical protein